MAPKVAQRMRNTATQKRGGGSSVRPYARPAAAPSVEPESRQPDCDLFDVPPIRRHVAIKRERDAGGGAPQPEPPAIAEKEPAVIAEAGYGNRQPDCQEEAQLMKRKPGRQLKLKKRLDKKTSLTTRCNILRKERCDKIKEEKKTYESRGTTQKSERF